MTVRTILRDFADDSRGTILVIWGMAIAVVMGLVAMSFDFGRIAATQSELQSFADHVALASAAELDGKTDAITRATGAAAQLVTDRQSFGNGSHTLNNADYTLTFFSTLPAADTTALTAGQTTDPKAAIYVRVVVTPRTVPFTFGAAFYGMTGNTPGNNQTGASAVAGFTQYACDVTPMMFCIPDPSFDAANPATIGKMIRLRSGGQGAAWGPGNFGFLEPSTAALDSTGNCAGSGGTGPTLRCVLGAIGSITQCFAVRGVDTEPGQKVGITNDSLNTRFDMWSGAMKNEKNNPIYAPAPNVIKGIEPKSGGACNWNNPQPTTNTAALPRDTCLVSGNCAPYGDGDWSAGRASYVTMNYGATDPHPGATTRYQYYLAEIAAHGGAGASTAILTGRAETGRPMCSANQSADPERRVLIAAGIDCAANPIAGRTSAVPVHQFVKMFLTEPVVDNGGSPSSLDIYAEIIGAAGGGGSGSGGSGGIFHDVVQLYR